MTYRHNIASGAPWEKTVGYSRAVRIGNIIAVAGTVASDDEGNVVGKGDIYTQTVYILRKIEVALNEAGASLEDVIRTRMFITDISQFEAVGRAHGEFFKDIRPAATMVEVKALVNADYLIEIEVDAVLN